jgi:sugar lactone lactonase YvrE
MSNNNKILIISIVSIIILAIFIKLFIMKKDKENYYIWETIPQFQNVQTDKGPCNYRKARFWCDEKSGYNEKTYYEVVHSSDFCYGPGYSTYHTKGSICKRCKNLNDGVCVEATTWDGRKANVLENQTEYIPDSMQEDDCVWNLNMVTRKCSRSTGVFEFKWGTNGSGTSEFSGKNLNCCFVYTRDPLRNTPDSIVVSDAGNHRIQIFDQNGNFIRMFGSKGNLDCQFNTPNQVVASNKGEIYIADSGNNRIQVFDMNGNFLRNFGSLGRSRGKMIIPTGVALSAYQDEVIVISSVGCKAEVFSTDGVYKKTFGNGPSSSEGSFMVPWSVATARNGEIVIMDTGNNKVLIFDHLYNFKSEFKLEVFPVNCEVSQWEDSEIYYNTHTKEQKRHVIVEATNGGTPCPPLKRVIGYKDCVLKTEQVCVPYTNPGSKGGFITMTPYISQYPENGGTPCPDTLPPPYPATPVTPCEVNGECPWGFLASNDAQGRCFNSGSSYLPTPEPNKGDTLQDLILRSYTTSYGSPNLPKSPNYLGIYGEKNLPKRLLKLQHENVTWKACSDFAKMKNATLFSLGDNKLLDQNIFDYSADKVLSNCYYNENDISDSTSTPTKINASTGLHLFENYTKNLPIGATIQDTEGNVYPQSHTYAVQALYKR